MELFWILVGLAILVSSTGPDSDTRELVLKQQLEIAELRGKLQMCGEFSHKSDDFKERDASGGSL